MSSGVSMLIHLLELDVVLKLVAEMLERGKSKGEGKGSWLISLYLDSFRL